MLNNFRLLLIISNHEIFVQTCAHNFFFISIFKSSLVFLSMLNHYWDIKKTEKTVQERIYLCKPHKTIFIFFFFKFLLYCFLSFVYIYMRRWTKGCLFLSLISVVLYRGKMGVTLHFGIHIMSKECTNNVSFCLNHCWGEAHS